jgi:hypothetical protein
LRSSYLSTFKPVPRATNHVADTLALAGSCFTSDFVRSIEDIKVQILHRPALPDNVDSWQVFDTDEQICRFLQNKENLKIYISTMSWKRKPEHNPIEDK